MTTNSQQSAGNIEKGPSRFWGFATFLMVALTACFLVQHYVVVVKEKPYDVYLALSDYGMKTGQLWQVVTCHLLHLNVWHLLADLLGLWFLGRAVEGRLGSRRFLFLYATAAVAGAVLQGIVALGIVWLPESVESVAAPLRDRFGGPVVGASVGLCGVLAGFLLGGPRARKGLFWVALGLACLPVLLPTDPNLAHIAHLGGLLTGALLMRRWTTMAGAACQPMPAANPSR